MVRVARRELHELSSELHDGQGALLRGQALLHEQRAVGAEALHEQGPVRSEALHGQGPSCAATGAEALHEQGPVGAEALHEQGPRERSEALHEQGPRGEVAPWCAAIGAGGGLVPRSPREARILCGAHGSGRV